MLHRWSRPLGLAIASLASIAVVGSAAGAEPPGPIVLGRGMVGVTLGETPAQARAVLGNLPAGRQPVDRLDLTYETANGEVVDIEFEYGHAYQFTTMDPAERTARGIGPGSRLSAVTRAYPHAHCVAMTKKLHEPQCIVYTRLGNQQVETDFAANSESDALNLNDEVDYVIVEYVQGPAAIPPPHPTAVRG